VGRSVHIDMKHRSITNYPIKICRTATMAGTTLLHGRSCQPTPIIKASNFQMIRQSSVASLSLAGLQHLCPQSVDLYFPLLAFSRIHRIEHTDSCASFATQYRAHATKIRCSCCQITVCDLSLHLSSAVNLTPFARRCAFVNFKERSVAELAAQAWANGLEIDDERVAVKWGRSRAAAKPSPQIDTT